MSRFENRSAAASISSYIVLSAGLAIALPGATCSAGPVKIGTIAYTSQQATGLPAGVVFADLADPRIQGPNSSVAFWAKLAGPGITANNDTSLWFTPIGGLSHQLAIRKGDIAAGTTDPITGLSTPLFGFFDIVTTTASFNTISQPNSLGLVDAVGANPPSLLLREDAGFVGLGLADASDGGHLLVRSGDGNSIRQANFSEPFTELIKVGEPALNTGLPDAVIARLWDPSQGGFQSVIFRADITYTGQTAPMTGLFVSRGTQPSCIARLGSPATEIGAGAVFSDFSPSPRIDGGVGSYFWATVTPVSGPKVSAIYREINSSIGLVVRSGIEAPGLPGLTLASIDRAFEIHNGEPILFSGSLSGPGVTASNNSAIWTWDQTFGFTLIAREGDPAPGCGSGASFGTLGRPGINNSHVAFTAWLTGPSVSTTSNYALFIANPQNHRLSLIARTGSSFTLPPPASGTKTVKDIVFDQGPNQSGLSQMLASTLVYKLIFTDASAGLFWADAPGCAADTDNNGFVTGDDFDLYTDYFEAGDPRADFDNDGFVNGDDFDAYVAAFQAGC